MDKMVDMKMDKQEKKDMNGPQVVGTSAPDGPDYPYGLEVSLEDPALKKMGVDMSMHKVGDEVVLHAKCKITRMSQSETNGGDKNRTMGLQITDMCVDGMMDAMDDGADGELDWNEEKSSVDKKLKKRGLL